MLLDRSIDRFKQGEAAGVFETKMTIKNVIEQLDTQLKQPVEESPFYGPIKKFPADFSAADKARLDRRLSAPRSPNDIYPAMKRLRDYLAASYLPKARDGYGLMYMKGGDALYRYLVQSTTTLPLTPEEIHETGLSEVARITAEMEKVKQEVGFKGTLPQFFDHLRTDPKYQEADPRGADPGLLRHRQGGRRQAAGLFLDHSQGQAGDPPLRAVPREVRGRRQL